MRHTILSLLVVMALIAYVQRAAISVPLPEIAADLGLVRATWALGLLQSAWQLGYALCQLPAGVVADRMGSRRTLVVAAVLWSVATGITAVAPTYGALVAAWTAMGIFQAAAMPCAVRTIGGVFGGTELARASGWLGAGMLAGGAIAPVLTAWLLERVGRRPIEPPRPRADPVGGRPDEPRQAVEHEAQPPCGEAAGLGPGREPSEQRCREHGSDRSAGEH
ncbi:MAG: MFS transporter, partial [Planctomycetaceae bacterium]